MGYTRKLSDLCICSNFQIQSRTIKRSFIVPTYLFVVGTDTLVKHKASFSVKQEIACTTLGTNKRGQQCSLIGL